MAGARAASGRVVAVVVATAAEVGREETVVAVGRAAVTAVEAEVDQADSDKNS